MCDYLVFERVHFYTYDFFAERLGFKLVLGCLCLYPCFYMVGLWSVADLPNPQAPAWLTVLAAVVFFAGWVLARSANMQKFTFKQDSERVFLGLAPCVIGDGEHRLLFSGFWGLSRHINYLGEILMATGLALALGWPWVLGPWLYPLLSGVSRVAGARRRPALHGKVRSAVGAVPREGAMAYRTVGLLR